MKPQDYLRPAKDGCILSVDASPGADRTEIAGINPWRGTIQIRIAAEPREGAANEELVKFLATKLGVPTTSIAIVRGARSSRKTVHVKLDAEKVKDLMGRE
ncbi:MAG: YggU family protein [Euryarchaeota archaeon RBG_13_57_23]|nr:MAG: YggU family protein [Euryarchaeota archaeon RBG_13_57_23]